MRLPQVTACALVALIVLLAAWSRADAFTLLQFQPILQVNQLYDDNITLTPENPQGDFLTNVMTGADLAYHSPGRSGSFQYETVLEKFEHHSRYDVFMATHFLQLNDEEHFSDRTQLSFNDWFLKGKVASALLTSGSAANPTPGLNSQLALALAAEGQLTSNLARADLVHYLSESMILKAELEQQYFSSSANTSFLTSGHLQTEYSLLPTLGVGGSYGFYDFRLSQSSPVQANYPALRLRWHPSRQLTFEGSGGPIVFQGGTSNGGIRAGYQASGTYESPSWRMIVKGGQAPGIISSGSAGLTRDGSSTVTYLLSRRTTLFVGLGYYEYLGGQDRLQILSYGGGVSYRWNKWLVLYTQYVGLQRYSGAGANTASVSNIYMTGISISFDLFRRAL